LILLFKQFAQRAIATPLLLTALLRKLLAYNTVKVHKRMEN